MKKILILSTLFAIAQCLFEQTPLPFTNNNDIINAKNLCRQILPTPAKTQFGDKFDVTGLNGPGTYPNEVSMNNSAIKETNSVWYTFKIDLSGTLKIKIKALIANDDIDFILYRKVPPSSENLSASWNPITAALNGPILNNSPMYCFGADTGLQDGEVAFKVELDGCQSNNGTNSNGFVPTINALAGQEYRLFINNWYTNGGFNLDFTDSDCTFTSCSTPLTAATITSNSLAICPGTSTTLQANATGGTSPFTYKWATTTGTILPTLASLPVSPTTNTTYSLTITDAIGTTATKTVTVTMLPLPTATITANVSISPICSGLPVTLVASTQGNTGYKWNCTTDNSSVVNITANTNLTEYRLTVTGANGCTNIDFIRPIINATPTVTIARTGASTVCPGTLVLLTATASNVTTPTYKWNMSPNTLATPILTNPWNITATTTRIYTVTATSAQNCTATKSETITVANVPGCGTSSKVANTNNSSLSTFKYFTEMQLSPNPTNSIVVVTVEQTEKQAIKFELFNNIGQLLETIKSDELSKNHQIRFDLTFRPVGIYYIKANNSLEEITKTLIKQ